MSMHEENVGQVDYISDAPKDGNWYQILFPNNNDQCDAQVVRWDSEYSLWSTLMISEHETYPCYLLEDGSSWSDTINI